MAKKKNKTTFGTLSLALFWLVLVSGVILAIPFDVSSPYTSISTLVVTNPWASYIRNFHFWSSQFFLVLSLVHIYDHFHYKNRIGLKKGVAFRLSLGVLVIFLAMLTAFLLKADVDSLQARQILDSLTKSIPVIGEPLAYSLLGKNGNFQLIYVHHIATFTVFLAIIMVEHSRKFWPPAIDYLISFGAVAVFSYLFTAPLHDNINPSIKGPWYFVGFQEILHWLKYPGWSLLLVFLILILIYLVNSGKQKVAFPGKRSLLVLTVFYFLLTLTGLFFRGEQWQWKWPGSEGYRYSVLHNFKTSRINFSPDFNQAEALSSSLVSGKKESCLVCHTKTFGFSESHDPEAIGCFSCHGGNPFATGKKAAHRNMINIPGNLVNAARTCGTTDCHPDIVERVPTSLMSTLSGMISVNRTVFGEQENPDLLTSVHELDNSAADEHLRNLCVRCHLGNPKTEYGPPKEWTRGGGCLACHLNYSEQAERALKQSRSKYVRAHPTISIQVTNNHCFGCHNRSGRIATNYEGWHETTLKPEEMPDTDMYRLLEGRRVFEKQQQDVHHKLGLECIDCHHSYELMGDGNLYAHQEDQQDVQCKDCHFEGQPKTIKPDELDNESALIAALRYGNFENREFLTTTKFNRPLINTYVKNDSAFLVAKNKELTFYLSAPAEQCTQTDAHANLACSSCHTAWASSCIDCHNTYDPNASGFNMENMSKIQGTWVEESGLFEAKLPALGIRSKENKKEVVPVIPGMVLTIDKKSYTKNEKDSTIFQRLFAPVAPHTTSTKGRGCKTCHNNPVALGFGEGNLKYITSESGGKWTFEPKYENHPNDNLPKDAWIGFLANRGGMVSTRKNVSPFNVEQQKQILKVGACLTCHDEDSAIMLESLNSFDALLEKLSPECILPAKK